MEDHLRNKDRLMKEWEALCSYQAEPSAVSLAQSDANAKKNRCPASVPCECGCEARGMWVLVRSRWGVEGSNVPAVPQMTTPG